MSSIPRVPPEKLPPLVLTDHVVGWRNDILQVRHKLPVIEEAAERRERGHVGRYSRPSTRQRVHWVLDIDGVCVRGTEPIKGGPEALRAALGRGDQVTYMTNNAMRRRADIEQLLVDAGYPVPAGSVLTSPMAALTLLHERAPAKGRVIVVGESALCEVVAGGGFRVVKGPESDAVVVGNTRRFSYDMLSRASAAVRAGATYIATNTDATLPTERGEEPGAGSLVAAISTASGRRPIVAGKPERTLGRLAVRRSGGRDIVLVGDRPETDMAMARRRRWRSILVLTGVTTAGDLPFSRPLPDALARDIRDAVGLGLPEPLVVGPGRALAHAGRRRWQALLDDGHRGVVCVEGAGPGRVLTAAALWANAGLPNDWSFPVDVERSLRSARHPEMKPGLHGRPT
jgi:glycerol-1-phosphatase